jgi:DNA-binding MarR family transcriptional regulator
MPSVNDVTLIRLLDVVWRRAKAELNEAEVPDHAVQLRPSQRRVLTMTPPEGARVTELAARTTMTAQALGQFVEALTYSGHLEAVPDPADRRAKLIRPTEKGRAVAEAGWSGIAALEDRWRAELGDRQWRQLRQALARLAGIGDRDAGHEGGTGPTPA